MMLQSHDDVSSSSPSSLNPWFKYSIEVEEGGSPAAAASMAVVGAGRDGTRWKMNTA